MMTSEKEMSLKRSSNAGMTNRTKDSLVKVKVRSDDRGQWIKPENGEKFFIDEEAVFPDIEFEFKSDLPGPYQWEWKIIWLAHASNLHEGPRGRSIKRTFMEVGKFVQEGKSWNARSIGKTIGGTLRIEVQVGNRKFVRTVEVLAKQPGKERVLKLIREYQEPLMEKIVAQESNFKHVLDRDQQPIVSGDKGFGLSQLTVKPPTYEQVWSWRKHMEESISRLRRKRADAKAYLSTNGARYTQEMLDLETITRWNGMIYHEWDKSSSKWIRLKSIQCDTKTGNIGWDMTKQANAGKTEDALRERDKKTYAKGGSKEHPWIYHGACYADHIANK